MILRGVPMEYKDIAKEMGISTNEVKRIESIALRKLFKYFDEHPEIKNDLV